MSYYEVGRVVETPPKFDQIGSVDTEATFIDGWHVNTVEPVPAWEEYRIPTPATPACVYAGGVMPVCYRFPDKESFQRLLSLEG